MGALLNEIFDSKSILLNLDGKSKETIFSELIGAIAAVHPGCDEAAMLEALWERENKMSTGIASGIAIPHTICREINGIIGAIGISKDGIDYDALDEKPVYVIFMMIMGEHVREKHLRTLNHIFRLVKSDALELMRNAKNVQEINSILAGFY